MTTTFEHVRLQIAWYHVVNVLSHVTVYHLLWLKHAKLWSPSHHRVMRKRRYILKERLSLLGKLTCSTSAALGAFLRMPVGPQIMYGCKEPYWHGKPYINCICVAKCNCMKPPRIEMPGERALSFLHGMRSSLWPSSLHIPTAMRRHFCRVHLCCER